ncbi:MAG: hypothetical protein V1733_10495 [bacterium]
MLSVIRTQIGEYFLKRESATVVRHLKMVSLSSAKSVGILYPLYVIPDYNEVAEFVSSLQHQHKEVKALGFVDNKNLIKRFLPKLSYDFFSWNDLNWFYKPLNTKVKDFISQEFDLLIDLCLQDILAMKYIMGLSKAHCRVGRYNERNRTFLDLMIDPQPMISLREYIAQVRHYLTIINQDAKPK